MFFVIINLLFLFWINFRHSSTVEDEYCKKLCVQVVKSYLPFSNCNLPSSLPQSHSFRFSIFRLQWNKRKHFKLIKSGSKFAFLFTAVFNSSKWFEKIFLLNISSPISPAFHPLLQSFSSLFGFISRWRWNALFKCTCVCVCLKQLDRPPFHALIVLLPSPFGFASSSAFSSIEASGYPLLDACFLKFSRLLCICFWNYLFMSALFMMA